MADFTQDRTMVCSLIEVLKADQRLHIWDKVERKTLFKGKVYQLYDNHEFDTYYIEDMHISFALVNISIRHL